MADSAQESRESGTPRPKGDIAFSYYVVALFDLLGQSEHLKRLGSRPRTADEQREFEESVCRTLKPVKLARTIFEEFFDVLARSEHRSECRAREHGLSPEAAKRILTWAPPRFQHFSDMILAYSPLVDDSKHANVNVVYAFIGACCGLMAGALELGIPVRGSLTLGLGTDALDGQIYGYVLYEAYSLESEVSGHPRIVVGEQLLKFLSGARDAPAEPATDLHGRWKSTLAKKCLDLLSTDEDGMHILDYFGHTAQEIYKLKESTDSLREQANRMIAFAAAERSRFAAQGNFRLAGRYASLLRYLQSRCTGLL